MYSGMPFCTWYATLAEDLSSMVASSGKTKLGDASAAAAGSSLKAFILALTT